MPIPVVLGLPWLAGLVAGLFSSLFTFFASFVTKRLAITAAAVVLITTLTAGLFAALEALVATLTLVMPTEVSQVGGLVTPSNLTTCISIMVSARLLRYAYDWNVKVIQYKLL